MAEKSTTTTGGAQEVSIEKMLGATRELELLPLPDQWVVIDPRGQVYRGRIEEVLPILMPHHPLLQIPLPMEYFGQNHG